ncbi:MAG: sugar transferase [Planktotalea sp.]|uniref:sugar transferase n=1 Tax=Planktotalea sp. TaxID=2029877 RepID=UPI003C76CE42
MQVLYARPQQVWGSYALSGKRVVDLALVILCAPLWLPLIALLWLGSWIEAGQGFYIEKRVGFGGQLFNCFKIRTMHCDVARGCAAIKSANDPRVTRWGRLLRRSSLDELPQLICVLKGEMSLVGPRPVPLPELSRYGAHQMRYLALRPGLTGLWQVSGRNALPYSARVALDLRYGAQVSFRTDMGILLATLREIWRMSGR